MYGSPLDTPSTSKMYDTQNKQEDGQIYAQSNETNSAIKTVMEEWYKTNIEDSGYGNVVADSIFCNDRSTPGKEVTGYSYDTGLGYGQNKTAFGAPARLGS